MDLLRLENSSFLYALILIPVLTLIYILWRISIRRKLEKVGDPSMIGSMMPESSSLKHGLKFGLLMFGLALLILGAANPQIGTKLVEYKREGVDVVIAIDISNSMMSEDIKPDRLSRAKFMVSRLIDKLQEDRIGVVIFAGDAFLQLPLTADYSAAKLMLSTIETDLIPGQGTAIGKAINIATDALPQDDKKHKVVIVVTDGENHEDDAIGAASEAAKRGIVVHTIGMGTLKGGPIPLKNSYGTQDFLRDESGQIIMTKLDASMLQQIASAGGGTFSRAADSDPELMTLLESLSKMEKKEYGARLYTDYEDRFQIFLLVGLLIIIGEIIISERKNKYLGILMNFVEKKL